jgi:hypothetical protein
MLDINKPFLIGGGPIPAAPDGNDDPPAIYLIRHHSERRASLMLSSIKRFRDEPTQINVGNTLLSHASVQDTRDHFFAFSSSATSG